MMYNNNSITYLLLLKIIHEKQLKTVDFSMTNVYNFESGENVYDAIVKMNTVINDIEKEVYLSFPKPQHTWKIRLKCLNGRRDI